MDARKSSLETADAVEMGEVHSVSTHQINEFTKGDYAGAVAKTDPEEIRLVRKLDRWIMPILWVMYFLNYIDRGSLAQARLNHLERDLGMHGENFNVAVSSLSVGYILMQVPSNMLITRVRPSAYLSIVMFIWSVLSACTGLVRSFGGLVVCRFLLGLFEAPFWPGSNYLLATFYTRKEVSSRMAIMCSACLLGMGVVNLIAHRIFRDLDGARGINGWRWMYLIQGSVSGFVAVCSYWILPDGHETTRWLNAREGRLAAERTRQDRLKEAKDTDSLWNAVRQAASDKRTWLFCLMTHAANVPLCFTYFFPTIISAMGYGDTKALLLACPPYLCAALACIAIAWSSGWFHERTWHITVGLTFSVVGFVVAATTMSPVGRYVTCYIFPVSAYMITPLIVSWTAATLSQSPEKKAVTLGMLNVSSTLGYIYGPYLWPSSDGPRYAIGFGSSAAYSVAAVALCWLMRVLLRRENERMKRSAGANTVMNLYGY